MKQAKIFLMFLILICGILTYSCGYHLSGSGNQIPDYVKSIYIPDFENKSNRFQAEQFVTFAIREEFIRRSQLVLVDSLSKADSILEGEITRFDVKPVSYSDTAQANLYRVTINLAVKFIDMKNNNIIYENKGVSFSDQYEIETGDFFSQETEALEKISSEFAASIVSNILENF